MNEDFNSGNIPPNPFSPIQTPDTFNRQRLQEESAMFQDPRLKAQDRVANDPETGAPIVVDELSYLTLEQQYPDYMANRSAARLEDQDTIMSKNSMGLEDGYQAAADGRIRSTYRYSTRSWLNQYDFLTDLDKEMFVMDSLNDEVYEQEVLDLTDNGVFSYAFLGGSKQVGAGQDIPNVELAGMNMTWNEHARQAQVASPEAIVKSFSLLLGERAEGNELIAQGLEGDEEAIEKMKVQVQKAHMGYRERDDRVAQKLIDMDHTVAPELQGYVDDLRSASEGFDSEVDRKLVEQFAQASAIRRFEHKVNYATHDFLDASKTPEERSSALRLIQMGAKVYGPDFIQNSFTNVREKGFDVNTAWSKMDKPTQEMVARLGLTLESLQERGFDPKNSVTFTYQVQQEMNRRIGADERQTRIMRDYDWEITRTAARLGYDAYRGIADDPVAMSEIGPGIVGGIGVGAAGAAIGLGGLASFGLGAAAGGAEAGIQTLYTSSEAQRQQMQQGLITSVSSGQMVQDALVIGATSVLLEGAFAGLGYGIGKGISGGKAATSLAAKTGLLGEENKNFAMAKELQQNLSNDDIAGIRIVAPNLTQQQQVLLQTREVNAVDAVKVAIESKVTDASSTDTLGDLLSPSVLDAQGISQLEAANFVQGVLRDLAPEEQMDAKTLGELWSAYATQRKEALAKPDAPAAPSYVRPADAIATPEEATTIAKYDSVIVKDSEGRVTHYAQGVGDGTPENKITGDDVIASTKRGDEADQALKDAPDGTVVEGTNIIKRDSAASKRGDVQVRWRGKKVNGKWEVEVSEHVGDEIQRKLFQEQLLERLNVKNNFLKPASDYRFTYPAKSGDAPAAKADAEPSNRVTRLQDELVRESDEAVDDLLFDSRITKEPTADLMEEVTGLTNRIINGESVEPAEFAKIIDAAVRTRSKATQQKFRDFFNTEQAKALVGEKNINKVNARLDEVLATTNKVRESDPDLDAATRVAGFFQRASDESSIRARGSVGYTKSEIIRGITAYIRTAGNPTARASLEARWGKGKLQALINKLNNGVEDVLERTEVQAYDLRAFKASDAYKDIRARKTARAELAGSLRRAAKKESSVDRRKATKGAKRKYKKDIEKLNKKATTKIDADLDIGIEEVEARIKSFETMSPIERRLAMAEGFSRLIDKVDPEAVSNAPVANDKKGMTRLFAGSNFGASLERAWANVALWPVSQSKLFRSRTRVVRGLANFIGNRHIGTTRYGDVSGSTVEGAVNAAKRQIAPIMGALRGIRTKMSRTAFGQFQSGVMRMRMTGQMELLRKASPEERGKLLSTLPRELQDSYSSRPDDLFDDLFAIDDMITNYNRQVLEEAKIAGLMKLDPDGNPLQKIDPSRYVPNNLNPNLTTSQRARLVDRITSLAKEQAMDSSSSLNTDVMVGLGWIKPTVESMKLDPNTGKAASDVTYEVPEDSVFFGITGKGSQEDAEFVIKNGRRGRAWLEEMAGAVRERANTTAPVQRNVANSRNFGSKDQPRPTSARGTARAANEETYVTGFDPVLAELQQRGAAMRAVDMTNMEPEELVNHMRAYDDILADMAVRQAEIAEAYRRGDLITPNGSQVTRPNLSAADVAQLAKNDEAFANISPGHNEMLGRMDTLVKNGTISKAHKRMLMSVFAPLDLNRAVGLSMHTRSPLDLKMRQLWEYDRQVSEDLEADGIFDANKVREEVDADIVDDPSILDEFSDDAETFGSAIRTGDGASVDLQRDLRRNQDVNAAATVLHEMNHVLFFNASPEVQAAAQHMFNNLRRGGVDSPTGRLMQANGMSKEDIRYAMSNVHEFVAHMGEIVLGGNSIKLARRGGEGFFVGLMNSLRDLFERLVLRQDMDTLAGKAGLNNETWGDVKELLNSIYSGVKEQTRIADVIRSRYTNFEDNLTMRFETQLDNVGDVHSKKSGLDENDWREEVLRAVRLSDPDFNDLPYDDQAAMLKGYYNDKGLVKEFFDIDAPSVEKKDMPVFEIDTELARPDYANLGTSVEGARSKLEEMEAARMAFLQDEDGNPRVMSDNEEAQYRMVDEAVESLRSRIAADEFTLETSKMSDEGYQRLLYILDHTDGSITESYMKNIIRNDGVHIPTTGGNAGVPTESLNTIVKKAKLDYKQSNKQTAQKIGASGSGGADAPSASELELGEAAANNAGEVASINSAEGVSELANTIGFMARTIRDNLSPEDQKVLDTGIVLLEVLERAHKEDWAISSHVLDEFKYTTDVTDIGQDALKKLVKENSLHPYTWTKLDKETQKAIKAEYKGILKASDLSSPKPVLNKMFGLLKREANTEDLARHFGESKKQIQDEGVEAAKVKDENKFVEAGENALEEERVLTEAKNTDTRSPEEVREDVIDDMVAKNGLMESVTAANAAGEVGMAAPGHPMPVAKLIENAEKAGSLQELHDNVNLFAGQDYRNEVLVTEAAVLVYHAGEWSGEAAPFPGIHVGSANQALDRSVQMHKEFLEMEASDTYMTSAVLPKGTRWIRVADTGGHDRVDMFIASVIGNNPALIQEGNRRGIDFQKKLQEFVQNNQVDYAGLGRFLKQEFDMDGFVYANNAEGSAWTRVATRQDGQEVPVNPQNDSFIVLNPDVLVDRASSPLLESKIAIEAFREEANEVKNPYNFDDSPAVNDVMDESGSFWEADNLESWTGADGKDRKFMEEAREESRYDFVDVGDYNDDVREYEFENANGEIMSLDINRAKTREGDAAIEVAFYRKEDASTTPQIYDVKTGAGDTRRMLTEIVERSLEDADEMDVDNIVFSRARGDGDRAYGMLLKRGLRNNPDWHVKEIDADLGEVLWTISRGPAPEGGPEIRSIGADDAAETKKIMVALGDQINALRAGNMNTKDADAAIAEASAFIEKQVTAGKEADSVANVIKLLNDERSKVEIKPTESKYDFVDISDSDPNQVIYQFENSNGETMILDINRMTTADGDSAVGVSFHRAADDSNWSEAYASKTGAGDVRRMLTEIMDKSFEEAVEMGVDNVVFTRTRGDGDRAYGVLLKRGLRDNDRWHVKTVDVGTTDVEWVVSRGPAPEGGPEIRGIKPDDAQLNSDLLQSINQQMEMLKRDRGILNVVADAFITDAEELLSRTDTLDELGSLVREFKLERQRFEERAASAKAKADREAAGEVDDRPVFGEEPKTDARQQQEELYEKMLADRKQEIEAANAEKQEADTDTGGGGEEPPKDKPTAEGADEEPDDFRKAFMEEYSDKAIDEMLNVGKKPGSDSVPGKLNNNGKHAGQDLIAVYDDGVNGKGTTDANGNGIDPIEDRSKQYVDTNVTDTAAVRSNNAEGVDLDILIGRTSGGIDETMSRRFDDADFETEIGQEIAEIFADNMDLTTNLMNYARGTGSRVKIQAMLNDAFGKGVDMSKLFKEAHDSIVELIQTDSKSGTLSAPKAKAAIAEAEESIKQMKLMFLNTLGYNVTQFDRASGVGKATNIAKNLAYSKLGGGFSQMVALVEAPFATLRTGGMGPLQILNNVTSLLGGIFMAGAGVVGRNVPGMGRLSSDYGIDKKGARFLSEDLVTFLDNFDGTSAMARFGFTGDQGNMAAFTFKDRALAQADRVKQASSGESRGADESWTGATIEAATGAVADMTGVMSGMEQVTSIARSIGVNIGRTSISKYGGKLKTLAKALQGQQIGKKDFISQARKLGIPRAVAIRANHAGLLADGGRALQQLEAVGGVRYGTSNGKQVDLNKFNDSMQKEHAALRSQGYLDDTVEEQIIADNKAIEAVQEYLLGFSRQASPELKGSLAMSKGDPIQQFLFSFLSYPMAAYQELVANGFKANGVASTAGMLALLASFEFNARMVRTMNDGTEEDREKAQKMWMDTYSGKLSMEQYLYVMANYGTQSPAFGHFGGWMGDVLNAGLDAVLPEDQANPVGDLKKQFPQSPFASPVVGTVQGVASSLRRGATNTAKAAFGNSESPSTSSALMRKNKNMARDLGTAIDVFTPFNSGAIQAFSQIATGNKLGAAIGNAAFVGQKGAGLNSSGATPPGFWESRKNRGYNQVNQFPNPADAPDYQKRLQDSMMAKPPPVWTSEQEKKTGQPPASSSPSNPSEGLADSLPDK